MTLPTDQSITKHGGLKNVTTVVGEGAVYLITRGIQLKMEPQHKKCHQLQFTVLHTVILHLNAAI